jgi:hypothetical protein
MKSDLERWIAVAERGFFAEFEKKGTLSSCEEQIAWAYFYGGERMKRLPAISLEAFLYEKTDKIETVPFGIESRFWFAGKEISDFSDLVGVQTQSDQTPIEEMLERYGIPISEFAIQSYVRDALFERNSEIDKIFHNIAPASIKMDKWSQDVVFQYIDDILKEFGPTYSIFHDKKTGPVRQRLAELHTAIIDTATRLSRSEINRSWLPLHTFIIFSQIQNHTAAMLEDLDVEEDLPDRDLMSFENSLDSMSETFDDLRETIDTSIQNFRLNNFSLVKQDDDGKKNERCMTLQLSLGGTDIWRRIEVPVKIKLVLLEKIIKTVFKWSGNEKAHFISNKLFVQGIVNQDKTIATRNTLELLQNNGLTDILFEYGNYWTIKILFFAKNSTLMNNEIRCVAGERMAPDEKIEGPLRYRRLLNAVENGGMEDRMEAMALLGENYSVNNFVLDEVNHELSILQKSAMEV